MKSKRAEEYLNKHSLSYPYEGYITDTDACSAVEIAEEDAKERVRKERKRWHDPQKELPNSYEATLVKVRGVERYLYHVLYYADCKWWRHCKCSAGCVPHYYDEFEGCIIGWQYIHE